MTKNKYPPGWDQSRVEKVLEHYEQQDELEAVAEDEAGMALEGQTLMEVPRGLVSKVRELIARNRAAKRCLTINVDPLQHAFHLRLRIFACAKGALRGELHRKLRVLGAVR
jgi:hypothetical protein